MTFKRRKWLLWISSALLGFCLLIGLCPIWFPWLLRPLSGKFGTDYQTYRRIGYQKFELTGVRVKNTSGEFRCRKLVAYTPTLWLWRCLVGPKSGVFVEASDWTFKSLPSPARHAPGSALGTFQKAQSQTASVDRWLPNVSLRRGSVQAGRLTVGIPTANWARGRLDAIIEFPSNNTAKVSAEVPNRWNVDFVSGRLQIRSAFLLSKTNGTLAFSGVALQGTNALDIAGVFPANGFEPEIVSLISDSFDIPAPLLGLADYQDITGSVHARWSTNAFTASIDARAQAQEPARLQPVDIQLRASGSAGSARVDVLRVSTPSLRTELLRPARILYEAPFLSEPVTLSLGLDLSQQHWLAATGQLTGSIEFRPGKERFPDTTFVLAGTNVAVWKVTRLNLAGSFVWPEMKLARAQLSMADGPGISLDGNYDVTSKVISDGHLKCAGIFGKEYLPKGFSMGTTSIEGQFSGPLRAIRHSATIDIQDLRIPLLHPMRLHAGWSGESLKIETMKAAFGAGGSILSLQASADLQTNGASVHVAELELSRSNRTELALRQPFYVKIERPRATASQTAWVLDLEPLDWFGADREVQLDARVRWPGQGSCQASARNLDIGLFDDFYSSPTLQARAKIISFSAGWTNSPILFRLNAEAELVIRQIPFLARADLAGGSNGIVVKDFSIDSATQAVCFVQGSLPVMLEPGRTNGLVRINLETPILLSARTEPDSVLWDKVGDITGLRLRRPELTIDTTGSASLPSAKLRLRVERIDFPGSRHPLPSVDRLEVEAEVDRTMARVSRLQASIEDQPVEFSGELPLDRGFWRGLGRGPYLVDWRQATARLKIQRARVEAFADYLPKTLSPEGSFAADIQLRPGGKWSGVLSAVNLRTFPIQNIGPIRDIQAQAILKGNLLLLTNIAANIGGQSVSIYGHTKVDEDWLRERRIPDFELHVLGTNVPLVRQPTLLLRADLNLGIANVAGVATIGGSVRLRDGLFLADLQSLVPEKAAAPKHRPPYFSFPDYPWKDWRLNVEVEGTNFMRVQSPIFKGKASAALKLQGTLKDPIAMGQVKIDSGAVSFPFGSLSLQQGFVSLTSENPYRPQLYVTAKAQRFGYDIKMEVSGPADAPVVQFSSMPPLTSEQVLLMLTTGQVPRGLGVTTTTGQRAEGLALFFGKNLLSEFGVGGGTEDRLTIRSGEQISESGRPTYEVEYQFTKSWSVIGGYDRFDQFNLNLKCRVYSR